MLRAHIVKTVFRKELREMLRDRRSLAVMFGVPLVLYPLLTVAMGALGKSKIDSLKATEYSVALLDPMEAPELGRRIAAKESGLKAVEAPPDPAEALRTGKVDAVVQIPKRFERDLIAGKDPAVVVRTDRSRTEADFVERKINKILEDYQEWIIAQRLKGFGAPVEITRGIERKNDDVSTAGQRMGNRLAQILPLLILITGMLGALFPALSATTTERELGTLETLLVTPAGRTELLVAKGLLVLLCGLVTAALNMISMSLVLWRTFSIVAPKENLQVNFSSLLLTFCAAVPALVFFTTLVMIVGLLARTFREANSYATPAMLLPLASLALSIADVKPTPGLLITPIANTTLIMRDMLRGKPAGGPFAVAAISSLVYAGLLLSLAARLFSNEQLVNPAWEPLSLKGLGSRRRGDRKWRLPAIDEALALFALTILLMFYVQPSLAPYGLFVMLVVSNVALLLGPAALFALLGKWRWRETFKLYAPRAGAVVGACLLGIGAVPLVNLLAQLQNTFWPQDDQTKKVFTDYILPPLQAHPVLTSLLVGAMAGIFEELLYRGPIQTALMRRGRPWTAIVIAAVLFAAAHLDLHGLTIRAMLGVLLGWVVWRTQSIVPAMLVHGLYDAGTLGLSFWVVRKHGVEGGDSPMFDTTTVLLLTGGVVVTLAGWWMIRTTRAAEPGEPPAPPGAFEVPPTMHAR